MKNALELQNVSKSFKGFETKDMTFSLPEGCILKKYIPHDSERAALSDCREEWGREKYYDPSDYGYDSQRQRNNLCVRKEY